MRLRWLAWLLAVCVVAVPVGCAPEPAANGPEGAQEPGDGETGPTFDVPEGTIAYMDGEGGELWAVAADGGDARKVADVESFVCLAWPQARGDGYLYQWAISEDESVIGVGWVDVGTGEIVTYDTALPAPTGAEPYGAFTADGTQCYLPSTDQVLRWTLPAGTMEAVGPAGLANPRAVILSPDGKKIAAKTDGGLLVMDADGQNARIDPAVLHEPFTFSGDSMVLFVGDRVGSATQPIYTLSVAGDNSLSGKQQWTDATGSLEYVSGVVVHHNTGGQLTTWLPDGSGITQVADFAAAMESIGWSGYSWGGQYGLSPSPDGLYVAVGSRKDNQAELLILNAEGEAMRLTDAERSEVFPQWVD